MEWPNWALVGDQDYIINQRIVDLSRSYQLLREQGGARMTVGKSVLRNDSVSITSSHALTPQLTLQILPHLFKKDLPAVASNLCQIQWAHFGP